MTDPAPAPAPSWGQLLFGRWAGITWTRSLAIAMHAVAWYILATALPSAVADVGGASIVSWVLSIYLVASIVSGSASGLLKARYGSRPILLVSTGIFLAGTVVAAAAPTMLLVVAGRALQGIGEGVIFAVTNMLVRDLYPKAALPRVYAFSAAVWSVAGAAGPLLSGLLTDHVSWRGALWTMAPLAAVYGLLVLTVQPPVAPTRAALRFPFRRLLAVTAGVVALSLGGAASDPLAAGAALVATIVIVSLAFRADRGAPVRLFPSDLLVLRRVAPLGIWLLTVMCCAEAAVGVYIPLLVQTLYGTSSLVAGYFLAIVAFAWTVAALIAARFSGPVVDAFIVAGPTLLCLGLLALGPALYLDSLLPAGIAMTVIGTGFGIQFAFVTQRVLAALNPDEGDVTAGALPTLQSAGAAFGAALAGLVGNLAGIALLDDPDSLRRASLWVMGVSAALGIPAVLAAVRMVRAGRAA